MAIRPSSCSLVGPGGCCALPADITARSTSRLAFAQHDLDVWCEHHGCCCSAGIVEAACGESGLGQCAEVVLEHAVTPTPAALQTHTSSMSSKEPASTSGRTAEAAGLVSPDPWGIAWLLGNRTATYVSPHARNKSKPHSFSLRFDWLVHVHCLPVGLVRTPFLTSIPQLPSSSLA
jgi:hypothetical protein